MAGVAVGLGRIWAAEMHLMSNSGSDCIELVLACYNSNSHVQPTSNEMCALCQVYTTKR